MNRIFLIEFDDRMRSVTAAKDVMADRASHVSMNLFLPVMNKNRDGRDDDDDIDPLLTLITERCSTIA